MVDGTIDPRSRGQNSVIGTIHGRPRPPIFGGHVYSIVYLEFTK